MNDALTFRLLAIADPSDLAAAVINEPELLVMQLEDFSRLFYRLRQAELTKPLNKLVAYNIDHLLEDEELRKVYFEFLLARKQRSQVEAVVLHCLRLGVPSVPIYVSLITAIFAAGCYQTVVRVLAAPADLSDELRWLKAQSYQQLGQHRLAIAEIKVLQSQIGFTILTDKALAISLARLREFDEAIVVFERSILQEKLNSISFVQMADLCLMARQLQKARVAIDKAIDLGPLNDQGKVVLARILRLERNHEAAVAICVDVVATSPQEAEAWRILAEHDGNFCRWIDQIPPLLESSLLSDYQTISMKYSLAQLHYRADNEKAAFYAYCDANDAQYASLKQQGIQFSSQQLELKIDAIKALSIPSPTVELSDALPIFVVGVPRSGSSLVAKTLTQSTVILSKGEFEGFHNPINELLSSLVERTVPLNQLDGVIERFDLADVYTVSEGVGPVYVIDKMLNNVFHVGLIKKIFPNAKVIQMRRDAKDVAWSIYRQFFPTGHPYSCRFEDIFSYVRQVDNLMDFWRSVFPVGVVDVSYSQLISDPKNTFGDLFAYLGVAWDNRFLNFHMDAEPSFTFSEAALMKPINGDSLRSWAEYQEYLPHQFK